MLKNIYIYLLLFLLNTTAFAAPAEKLIMMQLLEHSESADWRDLAPENTLYLDLPSGRVVIELAPEFAPQHVANIKAMAHEKYWDGLAVIRAQDNYVSQWGDPKAGKPDAKPMGSAKPSLPPEFDRALDTKMNFTALPDKDVYAPEVGFINGFPVARDKQKKKSWLLHCYGMVGAGRDAAVDSGSGSELYTVIGHSPRHLDRNVTLVGRVVKGIELLSSLPRGKGAMGFFDEHQAPIPILSVRLASEVPEKERLKLEVLRTDRPLFKKIIESRRNREEEWFANKAGHVEICNVLVTVREKK